MSSRPRASRDLALDSYYQTMTLILGSNHPLQGSTLYSPSDTKNPHPTLTEIHEAVHSQLVTYTRLGFVEKLLAALQQSALRSKEDYHRFRLSLRLILEASFNVHEGCATFVSILLYLLSGKTKATALRLAMPGSYKLACGRFEQLLGHLGEDRNIYSAMADSLLAEWIARSALNSSVLQAWSCPPRLLNLDRIPKEYNPDLRLDTILRSVRLNRRLPEWRRHLLVLIEANLETDRRLALLAPKPTPQLYLQVANYIGPAIQSAVPELAIDNGYEQRGRAFTSFSRSWRQHFALQGKTYFDNISLQPADEQQIAYAQIPQVRRIDLEAETIRDASFLLPAEMISASLLPGYLDSIASDHHTISSFLINILEWRLTLPPSDPVPKNWALVRISVIPKRGCLRCVRRLQVTMPPAEIESVLRVIDRASTAWKVDELFLAASDVLNDKLLVLESPVFVISRDESLTNITTTVDRLAGQSGRAHLMFSAVGDGVNLSLDEAATTCVCIICGMDRRRFHMYRVSPAACHLLTERFLEDTRVSCHTDTSSQYMQAFPDTHWSIFTVPYTVYGQL